MTDYFYDWRDREVVEQDGVGAATGTHAPITYTTYDNLDDATMVQTYDGDGVTITMSGGVPVAPSSSLLRSQTVTKTDNDGNVYQTLTYDVNQATGAVSSAALTTNYYFDARGDQVAESDPGGEWTKDVYNGAGELVVEYTTDGAGGTGYAAATSVANDNVLEQTQYLDDGDGNVIETIDSERDPSASSTGALEGPTMPAAVVAANGSVAPEAITTDAAGDVFMAGQVIGEATLGWGTTTTTLSEASGSDFVAELSAAGNVLWTDQTDATISSLAVNSLGSLYVGGAFSGTTSIGGDSETAAGYLDGFVWQLGAASGVTAGVVTFGGSHAITTVDNLAVGPDGDVYAAGQFSGGTVTFGTTPLAAGGSSAFVCRIDASVAIGTSAVEWVAQGGLYGGDEVLQGGLAVDAAGNAYVGGGFNGATATFGTTVTPTLATTTASEAGYIWEVNDEGATESVFATNGLDTADAEVVGVAVDGSGVYATGLFSGTVTFATACGTDTRTACGPQAAFVLKLDPGTDPTVDWVKQAGGAGLVVQPTGLAVDANGDVYAVGQFSGTEYTSPSAAVTFGGTDTLSWSGDGAYDGYLWQLNAGSGTTVSAEEGVPSTGGDVTPTAVTAQGNGEVLATGYFTETADLGGVTLDPGDDGGGFLWGTGSGGVAATVYFSASYYDAAGRDVADVDAGTNDGVFWERPASVPVRSDEDDDGIEVTSYCFNAAGEVQDETDPDGIVTRTLYDALGRTKETIQNYTGAAETVNSDVATAYTYDGDDNTLTVTAYEPGGAYQETEYVYGVTTTSGSAVGDDSDINSNDLLAAVENPDPDTGAPSTSPDEMVTYTDDAQGDELTMTDQHGTTHAYTYDSLGRITVDAVIALPIDGSVDGSVLRIEYAYDAQGNQYLVTTFNATSGGDIVNQVLNKYNGLGQLTAQYQSVSGAVDTETTPVVQYTYAELADGNNSRLTSIIYPDGYTVYYCYGSGLNNTISRLESISDHSGEDGACVTLESYVYQGTATVVERDHPQSGINLYVTLDAFGRVADQKWATSIDASPVDEYQYGYDDDGNMLYQENMVNSALSNLYTYDDLGQLLTYEQGTLNDDNTGIVGTPAASQSFGTGRAGQHDDRDHQRHADDANGQPAERVHVGDDRGVDHHAGL